MENSCVKADAARPEDIEEVDWALRRLESEVSPPRISTVVELRYFVGMTIDETAEALQVSKATVKRDWEFAKAWLFKELRGRQNHAPEQN